MKNPRQSTELLLESNSAGLSATTLPAKNGEKESFETFAIGLRREQPAVEAALSLPYSNGRTEGQVNGLKLVKRSMYGRAGFELLRRFVGAA